jgi:Spy/CpxP family protein refolding chaperone
MRKQTKVLLIAFALVASLAAAPALLANDSRDHGMMGRGGMMGNGGMMGMMGSMMRMMEHCSQMMGDDSRQPNDQWRKAPAPGEKR